MALGIPPQPTAPWRPYIFRVHCVVTRRWMKLRVPFAWYWFGDQNYGVPEVETGTIADSKPTPPPNLAPRLPPGTPLPGDAPPVKEEDLKPISVEAIKQMRGRLGEV
ncbi:hypothetical protein SEA_JACOREN57_47 [Mycobacterium phage JacoRen57]|nr:hypothetical protein SEA_JACOREN57_47 [Mycobacterium phage JacoRen57]